ncbi:MAG: hypothetical protein DMG31_19625 [Acidobacteria bacterium]|nr:MAG: hypothetical protein DMG31_19625 [Acidobacteriota bacterium]
MFQEAARQFAVLSVETRFVNLRLNGLQMPVGPRQEVGAAHPTFLERSDGGFGTTFGGAFERHAVSPVETNSPTLGVASIVQQRRADQNGAKVCLLE